MSIKRVEKSECRTTCPRLFLVQFQGKTTDADLAQLELDGDPIDPIGGGGALIGYARVSTRDQKLHRQVDALTAAGCHRIFEEKLSGKNTDRPELAKCLDYLRPGDTIVVLELWRLGRSLQDLISSVGELRRRDIGFKSLHEALDTTTPDGRRVFHVFAALAGFIRELIVEGTNEGLAAARARGVRLGRPPAMNPEQIQSARTLLTQPENTVSSIAKLLGVSRSTIYKYVPELTKQPTRSLEVEQQHAAAIIEAPQPASEPPYRLAEGQHVRPATTGRPTLASSSCTATVSLPSG